MASSFNQHDLLCRSEAAQKSAFRSSARSNNIRETFVEDRTHAHADHVGHIADRQTTWAIGVLKGITAGHKYVS